MATTSLQLAIQRQETSQRQQERAQRFVAASKIHEDDQKKFEEKYPNGKPKERIELPNFAALLFVHSAKLDIAPDLEEMNHYAQDDWPFYVSIEWVGTRGKPFQPLRTHSLLDAIKHVCDQNKRELKGYIMDKNKKKIITIDLT
jgi:hypothetical protein